MTACLCHFFGETGEDFGHRLVAVLLFAEVHALVPKFDDAGIVRVVIAFRCVGHDLRFETPCVHFADEPVACFSRAGHEAVGFVDAACVHRLLDMVARQLVGILLGNARVEGALGVDESEVEADGTGRLGFVDHDDGEAVFHCARCGACSRDAGSEHEYVAVHCG